MNDFIICATVTSIQDPFRTHSLFIHLLYLLYSICCPCQYSVFIVLLTFVFLPFVFIYRNLGLHFFLAYLSLSLSLLLFSVVWQLPSKLQFNFYYTPFQKTSVILIWLLNSKQTPCYSIRGFLITSHFLYSVWSSNILLHMIFTPDNLCILPVMCLFPRYVTVRYHKTPLRRLLLTHSHTKNLFSLVSLWTLSSILTSYIHTHLLLFDWIICGRQKLVSSTCYLL